MKTFTEQKFNIPELKGISKKTIEEHLKLYSGYVKNVNDLLASGQYDRRFPFEYNGMRNHEIYFSHFEGGPKPLSPNSPLIEAGFDLEKFKALALTRGVGWAVLWYDKKDDCLLSSWVDEQHLGQLNGCEMILALDMWEHSYVADYAPSGKKQYVEDFFANLNWQTCESNFTNAQK